MKKITVFVLLFAALILVSCSGSTEETVSAAAAIDDSDGEGVVLSDEFNEAYDTSEVEAAVRELSEEAQLMLGTILLDGTEHAVAMEQAEELLFLWQAYQALMQSDTTAEAELEALFGQIGRSMTEEQLAAIAAMDFTDPTYLREITELGLDTGGRLNAAELSEGVDPSQIPEAGQRGQSGQGGRPEGMTGAPEGMEMDPEMMEAFADGVRGAGARGMGGQQGMYLTPLITYLERISGGVEG